MNLTPLTREQERSFNRIVWSAVLLPIAVMVVASIVLAWVVSHLLFVTDWVDHTDKVIAKANHSQRLMLEAQTSMRGYLLTSNQEMLQTYEQAKDQVLISLDDLSAEVFDNPPQIEKVKQIKAGYLAWSEHADNMIEKYKQGVHQQLGVTSELMGPVMAKFDKFTQAENELLVQRRQAVKQVDYRISRARWFILGIFGVGVAYYVRRQLKAVARLYDAALLTVEQKSEALQISEASLREAQAKLRKHADELERIVAERTGQLRETVSELEGYSYSVSHDLRAPLRAVRGYAHVLQEDFATQLDPKAQEYLKRMMVSCDRMDALIQDVLSYSRISRTEMKSGRVDLERLIHEIIQQYPALHAGNVNIKLEAPFPNVNAPEALLSQCLSNLLNNAVSSSTKASSPKCASVPKHPAMTCAFGWRTMA